jgi:hypothetical protein
VGNAGAVYGVLSTKLCGPYVVGGVIAYDYSTMLELVVVEE